jgi:hypothetical protein
MAVNITERLMTITAANNFTAADYGKAVTLEGDFTAAASSKRAAGLLRSTANSGESVSVAYEGVGKMQISGSVTTPGSMLITAAVASGYLSVGAYALSIAGVAHGRAFGASSSGDMALAYFNFARG